MQDRCLKNMDILTKMILDEHEHQMNKWGLQDHDVNEWLNYTVEEMGELAEAISEHKYRNGSKGNIVYEAIQVVTLALKIAEMNAEEFDE